MTCRYSEFADDHDCAEHMAHRLDGRVCTHQLCGRLRVREKWLRPFTVAEELEKALDLLDEITKNVKGPA